MYLEFKEKLHQIKISQMDFSLTQNSKIVLYISSIIFEFLADDTEYTVMYNDISSWFTWYEIHCNYIVYFFISFLTKNCSITLICV